MLVAVIGNRIEKTLSDFLELAFADPAYFEERVRRARSRASHSAERNVAKSYIGGHAALLGKLAP